MTPPPATDDPGWRLLHPGDRWGVAPGADPDVPPRRLEWNIPADGGSTHWLRAPLCIPAEWRDQSVWLNLVGAGQEYADLEAIVYLDGATLAGVDDYHRSLLLPPAAHTGTHELLFRCALPFPQSFGGLNLQLRDEGIAQLGQMLHILLDAIETYPEHDPFRHALLEQLNAAYNTLDLRAGWQSAAFATSAHVALAQLQQWLADNVPAATDSTLQPKLLATGHAHLDVAWLWPLWRTRQKVAHTVATALHLMERYPDYHFSMSQPQVYAYLKQDDPALYARLKQRVVEGRFEPVGMMWLETDCNIPSGESLVRQLLFGARFFAAEFGMQNHIIWLPDVFGYSAALPQLMRSCGIDCFVTTKISWNQFNRMPCDTFRWRGIDGSEVLAHFITASDQPVRHPSEPQDYTYVGQMTAHEVAGIWNHYRQQAINNELLYIYGWGDGGGGPTVAMLEARQILAALPRLPQVHPGRVDHYFERLYRRVWDDPRLPVWVGELYLEYHRGTYTSQGRTKQANRAAELLYREAEWLNAWAVTLGAENQQAALNAGWQLILLNQFHDILPGSSIAQVYADSNADYAGVERIGRQVINSAIAHILRHQPGLASIPTDTAPANALLVFNSLPWKRRDVARIDLIDLPADGEPPLPISADATPLPTQMIETLAGERQILCEISVPAYGFTRTACRAADNNFGKIATGGNSPLMVQPYVLANNAIRLELDIRGEIVSLYDRRYDREIIARGTTGNQLVAYEDRPLKWDAWDIDPFYLEKPYPVDEILDWRVVEMGPLRAAVEITRRLGQSRIRQRICLWHNQQRIDFLTEVDWQERQMLLRTLFPLRINAARATCEIQFGAVERPTHRNTSWDQARFEVCAHRWVDLSEGNYGVALLNDGKYGHSLHHNTLGLSLLKGAIHPDPDADRGVHRFTYSLLPHSGDWRTGQVVRHAYALNVPLRAVMTGNSASLPNGAQDQTLADQRVSFVNTPTEHIVVETIKQAEDGDGLIVRLYEAHNQRGPVRLVFAHPIVGAVEVDLLERPVGPVEVSGHQVRCDIRPFEVKTLRVHVGGKR
jgi:alpha-mannosidase